jgi:hypothetical protein
VNTSQRSGSPGPDAFFGVDRHHDALAAEFFRRFAHEVGVGHGGGVDRRLVGASEQELPDIPDRAHAAPDRQRHEAGFRRSPHDIEQDAALLVARRDVEEAQLVGARPVVGLGDLDRIAGVAQIDEPHALDDAAVLDVEAGDEAGFKGHREIGRQAFCSGVR